MRAWYRASTSCELKRPKAAAKPKVTESAAAKSGRTKETVAPGTDGDKPAARKSARATTVAVAESPSKRTTKTAASAPRTKVAAKKTAK